MNVGQDLIVVTGATGQQGGAIARELLKRGHKVRAVTRKPEGAAARELARLGATVVAGDLDDAVSIERALEGAWGAFAVQNTWEAGVEREEEQGLRFADIAKAKGIQHLVYSSVASAHRNTGIPHFENKWRIEQRIRSLGFPSYVILRPVFFMQNFQGPFFLPYLQQGALAIGIQPSTRLQMIAVEDIGQYGLQAFERHAELNGRAIDIAGDEPTGPEAAETFTRVTGRPIAFYSVPIEEIRKVSEDYAAMLEWFDAVGYDVDIAKTSQEFGIRPTPLAEYVGSVDWTPTAATV